LSVSNSPKTYNGSGQAASVNITASSVPGAVTNILTGGGATKTNAGTYIVTADFVPTDSTNYKTLTGLSAGDFVIDKANATVVVTPYTSLTTTYDGNPHSATVTSITGINGETGATVGFVDVSHTTHTNAGTYTTDYWFFTGTANYKDIGNTIITDSIGKADATITVTPYDVSYDGDPHTASGTAKGVKAESLSGLDLSHTTHTNAGTYNNDYWSFSDSTGNYNNVGNTIITDHIAKADATITVTPYDVTYDGDPHTASGTAKGVKAESLSGLDLSHTTHTNAGTYNNDYWSFSDSTGNYNNIGNTIITDHIAKADATVMVTPYTSATTTYDGNARTATVTSITGGHGEPGATVATVDVTRTSHNNEGTFNDSYGI